MMMLVQQIQSQEGWQLECRIPSGEAMFAGQGLVTSTHVAPNAWPFGYTPSFQLFARHPMR